MASDVASAVYLIQLEDIDSPKTTAGELWLLDSDDLSSVYDICSTCPDFTLRCCSLEYPLSQWKPVTFAKKYGRRFSRVDHAYFHLLLAVRKCGTRLVLLKEKQQLLEWASQLCTGSRVSVRVRNAESFQPESLTVTGFVRYAGCIQPNIAGRYFGIELDPEFEGKGTSDGEFRKHRYFECEEDCAVFVSVDKLEVLLSPLSSHTDSSYFSDHSTGSFSETGRTVADMVETCALTINDRVVWMSDDGPEYGTVRWIGVLPDAAPPTDASQLTVGVEFDNPVGSGTGRYHSQTLFTAKRRHASLVPIRGLMKETDFGDFPSSWQLPSVVCADSEKRNLRHGMSDALETACVTSVSSDVHCLPDIVKRNETAELVQPERQFGVPVIQLDPASSLSSVDVKGRVLPPSVADADLLCSVNRGIQAYSHTCVLESVVFVLFAFYSYFDKQLFAIPTDNLIGAVKNILVEQIVNPLRATYFVSGDKMRHFGEFLTMIQSAKLAGCATSSVTLSDDPSGTITTVLCDLLQVEPLIALSNSHSYVYSVDVIRTYYPCPTLQHVIECSVVKNPNRRLSEHPQSVFIVSVDSARFGKLVPCGRIFPGLFLDISGIMHFTVHSCRQCGQQGSSVCGSCFTAENMREVTDAFKLTDYVFCEECFDSNHKPVNRQDHQKLPVATAADSSPPKVQECSLLELFAIVSFINERHVSFVKVGAGDTSAWLMYDGSTGNGNNNVFLPEIKHCQEIETWLRDIPASRRADSLPDVIVKITSGLRLCFYRPKHS